MQVKSNTVVLVEPLLQQPFNTSMDHSVVKWFTPDDPKENIDINSMDMQGAQ